MLGDTSSELIEQFGLSAFEAVHNSDLDGLVYFGEDGTIEYVNRAAMRIFGSGEEIVGRNIFELQEHQFEDLSVDLIFPSDHFDDARAAYEEGVPSRSEMIVIEGDERREIEVMWGPVEREGEIVGIVGSYRDVSSRPDIHDQLAFELSEIEKERHFLASILEELDEGLIVFDNHMELRLANSIALDLLGLEPPVEGLTARECIPASALVDPEELLDQLEDACERNSSTSRLHHLAGRRGRPRRLEISVSPISLGGSRCVCTLSDTTRRIELEQMELLGDIARSTTEGLEPEELHDQIVDLITGHLDVDFTVLTTYDGEVICPVAWRGILLEEDMCLEPSTYEPLRQALEDGTARQTEAWDWRAGGEEPKVTAGEQMILPLIAGGRRLGTLHLGVVESSQMGSDSSFDFPNAAFLEALANHVSAALQNVQYFDRTHSDREWLEAILEALPMGVCIYDRRGEILFVNASAIRITGYGDWSNLNTDSPPYRVLDPEDDTPLARSEWPLFKAVDHNEMCESDVIFDFDTHRRDVSVRATPIAAGVESPDLFVGMLDDQTERRRHDRRKDEFLSIASHELRSPLTPLTGVLQLARRQRERGDDVDLSLLVRAERQVAQLTRLIDGLLDLTRIETGRIDLELEPVELGALIERSARPWEYNPKDVDIEITCPDESVEIVLDPDRIKQVVTNLIDNAVKYSQTDDAVRIDVGARDDRATIRIEDDGVGMDEEIVAHVFDRFFHGRDPDNGPRSMGLGLYICRQIVEQHGGSIGVDSTKGEGTRIEITLPRGDETVPAD